MKKLGKDNASSDAASEGQGASLSKLKRDVATTDFGEPSDLFTS
jgi:hypothetical protein